MIDLVAWRLRVIRWHDAVCPDGSDSRSFSWKVRLATALDVSAPAISSIFAKDPEKSFTKRKSKVRSALEEMTAESFLAILGLGSSDSDGSDGRRSVADGSHALRLTQVDSVDEYADLCLEAGLAMRPGVKERALQRQDERRARQVDLSARWRTRETAWRLDSVRHVDRDIAPQVPMHQSEIDSVAKVAETLLGGEEVSPVTLVHSRPYTGIAHALRELLPEVGGIRQSFSGGIFHVYVDALETQKEVEKTLVEAVLMPESERDPLADLSLLAKNVARHLHFNNRLLIIHGATSLGEWTFLSELAGQLRLQAASHPHKRVSRILLTCWNRATFDFVAPKQLRHVDYAPRISSDAMHYFAEVLDYYLHLRRSQPGSEKVSLDSSVVKRVAHHYSLKSDPFTDVPSAVRFRAFCTSDVGAPSPFDPTQGIWMRVDEPLAEQIPEIAGCLADIQSEVGLRAKGSPDELATLRVAATGLFYVTEAMLNRLKQHPACAEYVARASLDLPGPRRNYIDLQHGELDEDGKGDVAMMPLLVRALLQDNWMRWDPKSHSAVHEALGDILRKMAVEDNKGDLQKELPYAPPRGHERIALALESIRHYMRASHSASKYQQDEFRAIELTRRALDVYGRYLEAGVFDSPTASDPVATRNASDPPATGAPLSRAYGLHGLKYEVLCLLSKDGRGREAPWGMGERAAVRYHCELGITLTRMIRPVEALAAFDEAERIAVDADPEMLSYINAHAVTAALLLGELKRARQHLRSARQGESGPGLSDADIEAIRQRNEAREAMLELAEGDAEVAVATWNGIANPGLVPFWGDRVAGYLDACLAVYPSLTTDHSFVWKVAEQGASKARGHGHEHERLRVEIRRASIARRMGYADVAEVILDQVGLDLGQHGGDELVFREFQLESVEALSELGRFRYAFAAYALPAFNWFKHGQSKPWIERSKRLCFRLLDQMLNASGEVLPNLDTHPYWKLSESIDRSLPHPFFSVDLLPPKDTVRSMFAELADEQARQKYRAELSAEPR